MTQKIWTNRPKPKKRPHTVKQHTNETANAERELKEKVGARQLRKMAKAHRRDMKGER